MTKSKKVLSFDSMQKMQKFQGRELILKSYIEVGENSRRGKVTKLICISMSQMLSKQKLQAGYVHR